MRFWETLKQGGIMIWIHLHCMYSSRLYSEMLDWLSLTVSGAHYNVTEGVLYSQSNLNWNAFPFIVFTQGQYEYIVLTIIFLDWKQAFDICSYRRPFSWKLQSLRALRLSSIGTFTNKLFYLIMLFLLFTFHLA